MDYNRLAELLFPNVTKTPEEVNAEFPVRDLPEGAVVENVHLGDSLMILNYKIATMLNEKAEKEGK